MGEEEYSNIREVMPKGIIGSTVLDITQHDEGYFKETGKSFVEFLFSTGETIRFYVGDDGIEVTTLEPEEEDEEGEEV